MFEKIKAYYESGAWSAERVKNAIGKAITEAEANEILNKIPERGEQK